MTSRERILAALRHKTPDRIPLDIGGTESSGFTGIAYHRFKRHLGFPQGKTRIFDVYQQVAKIEEPIRSRLGSDTVPLLLEPIDWKPSRLPDGSSCEIPEKWTPEPCEGGWVVRDVRGRVTARMPAGGFYFEPVFAPLADIEQPSQVDDHLPEIETFDWPAHADESVDRIASRAGRLHRETDLAVVANLQLHLLAAGQILRGYENFMMDLVLNKRLVHKLLARLVEAYIRRCDSYLDRVGKDIQVVLVNDDLGTQRGPMLSIETYRELILPYQKELFGYIKRKTDAFLLLHSCGSVHRFIPDLIEAGVDALNPVQVSADGMETGRLKREYGSEITFWGGGCDTQQVLNRGSVQAIEDEVRRRIDDLAPGGGFVFTQVHNIQPDVPPANVVAMLDAFRKYGG